VTHRLDAEKLAKVLALASSARDGEALAALRRAAVMLERAGLTFSDLVPSPGLAAPSKKPSIDHPFDQSRRIAALEQDLASARQSGKEWQEQLWAAASYIAELEDELVRLKRGAETATPSPALSPSQSPPILAPRTNAAKRAAVEKFLNDPQTARLSDREIARRAAVSPQTVTNWRRRLAGDAAHFAGDAG